MKKNYLLFLVILIFVTVGCSNSSKKQNDINFALSKNNDYFDLSVTDFETILNDKFVDYFNDDNAYLVESSNDSAIFSAKMKNDIVMEVYGDNTAIANFSLNLYIKSDDSEDYLVGKSSFMGNFIYSFNEIYNKDVDTYQLLESLINDYSSGSDKTNLTSTHCANNFMYIMHYGMTQKDDYSYEFSIIVKPTKFKNQDDYISFLSEEEKKKQEEVKKKQEKDEKIKAEEERKVNEHTAELAAKKRTFSAGKYIVGTDIESGKYDLLAISGKGNLFVRGGIYGDSINEMMGVTNPEYYIPKYSNATLLSGQEIEITSTLTLIFDPKE